jgi:phosphoribosyl 1,2-cyclic phosphodiesterase
MGLSRLCSYVNKISKHWLKHIVLVHLSEKNADEQTMADEVSNATSVHTMVAKDGMVVSLDRERGY